ncbi:flagellar biosynthesis protein FlhF [Denitrificimonas caeni]|mgnify:CR=1 FL=1|uniref:Flagellar biosynthesis protein FlhF n=1 Tax=Denitrificimonas caeni TaxID=521720 RepID=A0AAE9VMA3_9GAMM|nr:flagellar biosynthesis protein FlhF [Denitrificimonas caeni]NLJ12813.1 flagellar biosynthesis protein FlhF [Gammaproteobacteria bacterium]WBE24788.1 flagellar biosynthesis protein FlhF [Denitrificimonas caeni]
MQVKRYFAADMRQAMNRVREELGADASIISTRRVAGGVELTAALDYQVQAKVSRPNPALEAELRKTQAQIMQAQVSLQARDEGGASGRDRQLLEQVMQRVSEPVAAQPQMTQQASASQGEMMAMRSELNSLRELLEMQLGNMAWSNMRAQQPMHAALWKRFQKMGLSAEIIRPVLERVAHEKDQHQAWRMALAYLTHAVRTPNNEAIDEGGVIALVGPAGVGKTTTLAKLAARYVLTHGASNIALVSMDSYRIGAQEQLKTLGRILNIPVSYVADGVTLAETLQPLAHKKVVLIDTAGLPASDPALGLQLDSLSAAGVKAKNYLVMAATSQGQVLKAAWHAYKRCGLAGCIITKLDEAISMGEALSMAIGHSMPVAYTTDGPKIPDDLQVPRSHQLISRAVRLQSSEEPTEEMMAQMCVGSPLAVQSVG